MGKNKDSQQESGSKWERAYEVVKRARATGVSKVDVKEFASLTKSAGGKS